MFKPLPVLCLTVSCTGGISFFSNTYGWACDNVASFEVVLADGSVVNATPTEHADLYKALRGGGPGFGIVTDFKLHAYPYEGMWGGLRAHEYHEIDPMFEAFFKYGLQSEKDPKASFILNFGRRGDKWYFANDLQYCAPVENPPAYAEFMDIPAVGDETGLKSHAEHTIDLTSRTPRNFRNRYWALSSKLNVEVAKFFIRAFVAECEELHHKVKGFHPAFDIQIITTGMLRNMKKNGGNVLGLAPSEEPFLLYNPVPHWSDPADDDKVYRGMERIVNKTAEKARQLGAEKPFLYMNYASQFQDVYASYGEENLRFLHEVSRKYDPEHVFSRLQRYFTFGGPIETLPPLSAL